MKLTWKEYFGNVVRITSAIIVVGTQFAGACLYSAYNDIYICTYIVLIYY